MSIIINDIITDFGLFYVKINNYYKTEQSSTERWLNIARYMHENNEIVVKIYKWVKQNNDLKKINIDYSIINDQLEKQISAESDNLVKISLIALSLHQILYDLMSQDGNYYFLLNGQEEMQILGDKKITYYISVNMKKEQNIFFHAYILMVALESLFNNKFYLGIDFEYTNKKIQLAQLNFEHNVDPRSMIMIISPSDLEQVMMDNFVNLIICSRCIRKILHGSDSLDIPYMYEHMLQNDSEKIIDATATLIDTRFLCEYYKLTRDEPSEYRCSIYSEDASRSAVYYFSVVSDEQQAKLAELLQNMPPPFDITWSISKMPKNQILYAQYDVLFLKYFYYRMIFMATEDESSDTGKKAVITLYKHVLNEITRFIYLERNLVTLLEAKCKEQVDPINNYFVRKQSGVFKMIDIFNKVSVNLESSDPRVNIDKLSKVNHFKKPIMNILKRITYGFISKKCRVQKDKTTIWTDKLDNKFIFDFLEEMKFFYILKMFKDLSKTLESRISDLCRE